MPCSDRYGSTPVMPGMPSVRFVRVGSGHATDTARRTPMRSGSAYGVSAMVSRQNRACRVMARPPEPPVTFKRSVPDQPRPGCSGSARQDDRRRPPAQHHQHTPRQRRRRSPGLGELQAAGCLLRLRASGARDKKAGEDFGAGRVGPAVAEGSLFVILLGLVDPWPRRISRAVATPRRPQAGFVCPSRLGRPAHDCHTCSFQYLFDPFPGRGTAED